VYKTRIRVFGLTLEEDIPSILTWLGLTRCSCACRTVILQNFGVPNGDTGFSKNCIRQKFSTIDTNVTFSVRDGWLASVVSVDMHKEVWTK
jgi:hypothetical protein